jgi:translation elongation factor EF-G
MDRPGANLYRTIAMMEERLHATPILTQIPIGVEKEFRGIVDLASMTSHTYPGIKLDTRVSKHCLLSAWPTTESDSPPTLVVPPDSTAEEAERLFNDALVARANMIEQLAVLDEELGDAYAEKADWGGSSKGVLGTCVSLLLKETCVCIFLTMYLWILTSIWISEYLNIMVCSWISIYLSIYLFIYAYTYQSTFRSECK